MGMFDKIKEAAAEHGDKIEGVTDNALDKASEMIDEKTGGKFSDQIQQGRDIADSHIGEENQA